jgi:Zn finger protein HypA/HybF involved in hydrogenase expression
MPRLVKCISCGCTFKSEGFLMICPRCANSSDISFSNVRDYVKENPGVSMIGVMDKFNLTASRMKSYLRSEKMEIRETNNMFLKCERCGKSIRTGMVL